MLQAIHDKAKGWIAYAIVGFISIPFALWGINSYFEGGGTRVAATINGEEIEARQVENQLSRIRQQFGRMAASLGDDQLREMALNNVINQTLLRQKATDEGYRASAGEVASNIAQAFQTDGQYDPEQYQRFLQTQRRNQGEFENQVREDLTLSQFRQAITSTAFVPKTQAEYYQSLRNQKRDVEHFTLKTADFIEQAVISDDQVKQYYEANKASFMTDQTVKLAYIDINQEMLAESLEVNEDLLQQYYDENADRYQIPESRNTSHILISTEGRSEEEAQKRAEELYAAISSGQKTFEDAAKNDSDDKIAAEKNGELGEVVAGDWGPDFEKAVFDLAVNTVSEPVKTEAGYEIIRVNSIKEATQKTFADAKAELEEDYRRTEAEKLYLDKADQVQTVAYEQSGDLTPAAQAAGLAVQTTDWITRNTATGIANNPKVREAAFSEDVLNNGKNSEPLELSDTQAVVVRVVEQEAAQQKPLEEVKEDILNTLKTQEARKLAAQKGEETLAALIADNDWPALEKTSAGQVADVQKSAGIERNGSQLPPAVVSEAFAMQRPADDKASWGSTVLANGDYVLIAVKAVEEGATELDDAAKQLVNGTVSNREISALLKALRERADIELTPENI